MADEKLKPFKTYKELEPVVEKSDKVVVITMKTGAKFYLADQTDLPAYSNREDVDSFMFMYQDDVKEQIAKEEASAKEQQLAEQEAAPVQAAAVPAIDQQQTVATVEQPKADPVVPKPQPAPDHSAAITAMVGALAGAVSSAGMPALTNLIKNLIKNKLKGKKGGEKKEEEAEEPTDCKTHQLKSNAKMVKMAARIAALESKPAEKSNLFDGNSNPLEDLEERIEKLEKQAKTKAKGKKK
jgi:hypothetical protein